MGREICQRCNIFHFTCLGEKFEQSPKKKKEECLHRECDPDNTINPMQIDAFMSLYRRKKKGNMDSLTAFVEAVVQTSDDVFREIEEKNPNVMNEYYARKNRKFSDDQSIS